MARAGLGNGWKCLFANDFDPMKAEAYAANWPGSDMVCEDINRLEVADLPGRAHLVWASFPCQDLSLAGAGAGLEGDRSGTFWPFWTRVTGLIADGRKPTFLVLENVVGMLTSHGGKDFAAICNALSRAGYVFGAAVVDAAHFVPQSRQRVFVVAVDDEFAGDLPLTAEPHPVWQPSALRRAVGKLAREDAERWVWWHLPEPPRRNHDLKEIIETVPVGVTWHTRQQTERLLTLMSETNRKKLRAAVEADGRFVGTVYRRGRPGPAGNVQRAEIRVDGVAGCLRTPAGGSSRQIIIQADRNGIKSRLISAREAARLMGLPDTYELPERYNDAYHLLGDGLAVPAVDFIARHLLDPMTQQEPCKRAA